MPRTAIETDISPDDRDMEATHDCCREAFFALAVGDEQGLVCYPHIHRGRHAAGDLPHSGARSSAVDGMSAAAQRNHLAPRRGTDLNPHFSDVWVDAPGVACAAEAISAVRD